MAIDVQILPDQKLVHATCSGIITKEDLISYQDLIWKKNNVAGYNRLFNMNNADLTLLNHGDLLPFAHNAVSFSLPQTDIKLAIVAHSEAEESLGRFYLAAIALLQKNPHSAQIFRVVEDALKWISR